MLVLHQDIPNCKETGMQLATKKVTVNIPLELNVQLEAIKESCHSTMSIIFREALEAYAKQKEIERWERGIDLASKNREYQALCKEIGNEGAGFYEY
ncbi:MAG: hypothetical protein RL154_1306 [Pseudomonadota bacterium]|jgi:predicted DNA-binding protein